MSRDSASSTTLISKKHDIAQSVLSRKRKLCDLYAVATSAEPVPATHDFRLDASAADASLAVFLDQNDLTKGRYFRQSTIQRRPRQAASLTEIRNDARGTPSQSTRASRHDSPKSAPGIKSTLPPLVNEAQDVNLDISATNNEVKASGLLGANIADFGQGKPSASTPDASNESAKLRRSRRTGAGSESDRQATPHRDATPLDKPSRLDSPPYSPDSKAHAANKGVDSTSSATRDRSPVVSIPTPGKDESDHDSSVQDAKPSEPPLPGKRLDGKSKVDEKDRTQSSVDAADAVSSPSSSTARQSVQSLHSDARSPLTSPEDDGPQSTSDLSRADDRSKPKAQEVVGVHSVERQRISGPEVGKDRDTPKDTAKSYSLPEAKPTPSATTPLSSRTTEKANKSSSQQQPAPTIATALHEKADESTVTPQHNRTRPTVDETSHDVSKQSSLDAPEKPRPESAMQMNKSIRSGLSSDKKKITKRRRSQHRIIATVGNTRSGLRQRDGFKRSYSKTSRLDYFRLQIVREALNSVYGQDLHSLLSHCNIALKSTDWMLLSEEELYRIVLQRIHHLQNTTRWSLRQPVPAEEPKAEPYQWDLVVKDAKWLRSDFREERKQKLAVAYQLAKWCYNWVHSDTEARKGLQVKVKPVTSTSNLSNLLEANNDLNIPTRSRSRGNISMERHLDDHTLDDTLDIFSSPDQALFSGHKATVSRKLLNQIPKYASATQFPTTPSKPPPRLSRDSQTKSRPSSSHDHTIPSPKSSQAIELAPKDNSCALFWPESQSTRRRLTAPFVYKPPSLPMPPQGFYEHRPASQWTWEDDQKLRQNIKEYGANWHLIAHNLSPRQEFYSNSERRTPWECYERFLMLDPPQKELQTQYLKHFHFRIDKAHTSFDEQQSLFRTQAQQQASEAGRPVTLPNKRFPTPMRVERKQSKRFLAMLDSARRLARKRETALSKQEKSQQGENNSAPKASQTQPRPNQNKTPQELSQQKAEREAKEFEKLQAYKEQQKALLEQQKRQQSNYQASLTNGIGQQMRNGMANSQTAPNGLLAVPSPSQVRANAQQPGTAAQAQLAALVGRAQGSNVPNQQQRLAVQVNGQNAAANQESMARLMQHASQRQQQLQALRGGSPNMANAVPNLGMLAGFSANNQFQNSSDGVNSQSILQQGQNASGLNQSPHVAQALAAAAGAAQGAQNMGQNISQTLSSGHLPQIFQIQNHIQSINPNLSEAEARAQATEQLKIYMRRNAINAASGTAEQRQQQAMRGSNGQAVSQSPYANVAQMHVYQQNGLMASNQQQQQGQGRSQSPNSLTPQQQQYQNQLRQQIFNQQRQQQQQQQLTGDGSGLSQSPNLGQVLPGNMANMGVGMPQMAFSTSGTGSLNKTSNPNSVRPASRAASGVDYGSMQPPEQQQRPGSATGIVSQGFSASGDGT